MSREKRWAAVEAAYRLEPTWLHGSFAEGRPAPGLIMSICVLLGWEVLHGGELTDALLKQGCFASWESLQEGLLPFVEAAEEAEQVSKAPVSVFTDEQAAKIVYALKETLKDGLFGIRYDIDKLLKGACNDIGLFLNGPGHVGSTAIKHLVTLHAKTLKGDSR